MLFREGDVADFNTVLIRVDQKRYRLDVATARANLRRTEESLTLAKDLYERSLKAKQGASDEDPAPGLVSEARIGCGVVHGARV